MTDTDREDRLEGIRERLDEATPGPWEHRPNTAAGKVWVRRSGTFPWTSDVRPIFEVRDASRRGADIREEAPQKEADACLIAHAPQDIDWLLSEIDRLTKIEEAASDAWREYDCEMGLSEDVDAAIDYRELVTDDVDDAMWRLKAKLEGEDGS